MHKLPSFRGISCIACVENDLEGSWKEVISMLCSNFSFAVGLLASDCSEWCNDWGNNI